MQNYMYKETKMKAVETLTHGAMALALTNDHETNRKLAKSIMEAARLVIYLEDLQEACEKGDLEGVRNAAARNGF